MSEHPPDTIHVKRKRGRDEAPVDFLRVDRSKRFRSFSSSPHGWVYQRKQLNPPKPANDVASESSEPLIQPTKEGDEKRAPRPKKEDPEPLSSKPAENPALQVHASDEALQRSQAAPDASQPTSDSDGIRKFHLSKSVLPPSPSRLAKRRGSPAVFVERIPKRPKSTDLKPQVVKTILDETSQKTQIDKSQDEPATFEGASKTAFKRPGSNARTKQKVAENKTTSLPPSLSNPLGNMDDLSRAMDIWTLNEISKNLNVMENKGKYSPATAKIKPKAPKNRLHQRHAAEEQAKAETPAPSMDGTAMDVDSDATDDDDYIIETYERVPAERLRDQAVPAHHVGLLVFDNEPDMEEFFYGNEDETDDEFPEDEEDEDAENYYTHDYPDEDLDWDDEFDRNACRFATQNDSDNEEWDERDFSDEVWERVQGMNPSARPG
ncbi:hypothetical protein QBC42DRAFT_280875 [Cladorrhinum samala]|uniref:Transcription factor Iwr1 domain-containing protein n=1 Tax=Cladorrhinum samala TaxID=585594 RepID=A0AAV9H9Q4_9PEZI|nr:hypothetical protein QBC42DRAFT_280875 [Cladorrhinum samala]